MATRADVIAVALQRIRVLGVGDAPTADEFDVAGDLLDSTFDELKAVHGFGWTWTLADVPSAYLAPLGFYLATEVAPVFNRPTPETRARAIARLRAQDMGDDRPDSRDTDEDGIVSEEEAAVAKRAEFY